MAGRSNALKRRVYFCLFLLATVANVLWLSYPAFFPQSGSGQTYLLEVDPYAWLRATRLVLEHGYPGTSKDGRTVYDGLALAPEGGPVQDQHFLFYSAAGLYRLSKVFFGRLPLETFLFYLPIFFAAIFFIILYYFCSYFFSRLSGILAVLAAGFAPAFITRSCAGRFDSDVLNLIFPLAIIWLLAAGLKAKDYRKLGLFSLAAGFVLSVFAATWPGWWFILIVTLIFYLYYLARARKQIRTTIFSAAVFFFSSEFFCLSLLGREPFSEAAAGIIGNMGIALPAGSSLWPNVYWLVSELLPLNIHSILVNPNSVIVLCVYAFSTAWVIIKQLKSDNHPLIVLLLLWLLIMGFAGYHAQRFIFFAGLPAAVFLGVGIAELSAKIIEQLKKQPPSVHKGITAVSCLLIAAGLSYVFYSEARGASERIKPLLTDDYYEMLQLLRKETPSESIINAWWDYGNWIKEIARRRVLFDPQSQNRPLAYWFAQALCTDNEETSVRILRMLNNSSDKLFFDMQAELKDGLKCIIILKEILAVERDKADAILRAYGLSDALRLKIEEAIFEKTPVPAYLVLDKGMLEKISSISYLANWDFAKAAEGAGFREREALSRRWYFGPFLGKSNDLGNSLHFSNGIVFERDSLSSSIFSLSEKKFNTFQTTLFFDGKTLNRQSYPSAELAGGALIIKADRQWQSIGFSDLRLGTSMFSRLFFMEAKGLKHFELCFSDDQAGIYVYEIKW